MKIAFIYIDGAVGRGAGYVYASIKGKKQFFNSSYKLLRVLPKQIKGHFDIVMISSMTLSFPYVKQVVHALKAQEDTPILVGGVHPTVVGPSLLAQYPEIDYLCIGEGESFVNEFLDNFGKESLYNVNNLVFRRDGKIVANPVRPPEDLSALPKFPWEKFTGIIDRGGFLYVNATRGCPYACSYCCNAAYLKLYKKAYVRTRPVEQVIDELDFLKHNYKFRLYYFGDDMIFSNREYAMELFAAVSKLGKPYGCMGRVESIDKEMADHLSATGCKYVAMGLECGDEAFRKKHLSRFMTNAQIISAFKLLKARGIKTASFNMVGWPFPGEEKRAQATIKLNKEADPDYIQVTWFYPFPGTKLYEHCIKNDLIDPNEGVMTYAKKSSLKMYVGKRKPFESVAKH